MRDIAPSDRTEGTEALASVLVIAQDMAERLSYIEIDAEPVRERLAAAMVAMREAAGLVDLYADDEDDDWGLTCT